MKKNIIKISLIILALIMTLSLSACNKDKATDFEKLVKSIYSSEEIITGYSEISSIIDCELEIYYKNSNLKIDRGEDLKTEVEITEKKLSVSGDKTYEESSESYKTINNVKYTTIDGTTYENEYQVPTYFLTFVLSEEFLEQDYELIKDKNDFNLKAKVIDNKISSLFLNKSLGAISNLSIEIIVKNNKLQTFNATYITKNGFNASIKTTYSYEQKTVSKDDNYPSRVEAIFYLEGGSCQNTNEKMAYLYDFKDQSEILIIDPNDLEKDEKKQVTKVGYTLEGWYQDKIETENGIVYKNKWDFSKNKMNKDGITLYAKWVLNHQYSYELYYKNENNEDVLLDSYKVNQGDKFLEILLNKKTVPGYTSLGYLDEYGNEWDDNFVHPGGDKDLAIKIYLNLIKGEYEIVKTSSDFTKAISTGKKDIYICNDINMKGKEICFEKFSGSKDEKTGEIKYKTILGNGFKIYNFKVKYDSTRNGLKGELNNTSSPKDHLYISLFFELNYVYMKDLMFDEITIDVKTSLSTIKKIIIAPLAIQSEDLHLENIKINGSIIYTKIPNECSIEAIIDKFCYVSSNEVIDELSKVEIINNVNE